MPTRSALRVIEQDNNHQPGDRAVPEETVLAAYQVLADACGASIEITLDGQVVLYTGYFRQSGDAPVIHQVLPTTDAAVTAAYAQRAALVEQTDALYVPARVAAINNKKKN